MQHETIEIPKLLLAVQSLNTDFIGTDRSVSHAVEDVSFEIYAGQTLGLVGESGCGKTTTMLSLMRLLPTAGRITHGAINYFKNGDCVDLLGLSERKMREYRWKEIAMIFQGAMNALNPVMTVGEQIREPVLHHELMQADAADKWVSELLDLVGIAQERKSQYPHQYSGGMRQRAMIAMALACKPRLLLADEPTTALDVMIQAQVIELLQKIQRDLGLAILLVTHDLGVVAEVCDTVVVMYGGKIAEYGPIDAVYNDAQHPYTQCLLKAFPDLSRPTDILFSIPGTPPRLNALPPGCRFAPRCPSQFELCNQVTPPLVTIKAQARPASWVTFSTPHMASCHLLPKTQGGQP